MHPARQGNQPVVVAVVCIHRIARARTGRAGACHEAPIHAADGKAVKEETLCLPVKPATAGRQQASVLCPAPSFFFFRCATIRWQPVTQQTHWARSLGC
jgi:hypothetical protein